METWMSSIIYGTTAFLFIMPFITTIYAFIMYVKKRQSILTMVVDELFVFYVCCVLVLVFFPLPSKEEAAKLSGYTFQYIPFKFVFDIMKEKTLFSVLQVLFNVVMMMPLGFYLSIRFGFSANTVILITFGASLFIEIGQYTGLFFRYAGSYRLCDVDDLMCNTLGGYLGHVIFERVIAILDKAKESRLKYKLA